MQFDEIIDQWPMPLSVVQYTVPSCCANTEFYAIKIGDRQIAYVLSNEPNASGIRQFTNEYFKISQTTVLPVKQLNPVRISQTLHLLANIYKASTDIFQLNNETIRLTNFSFIVDFCQGIEIPTTFFKKPKPFKGKADFSKLRPGLSPVQFKNDNYAIYRNEQQPHEDADEMSDLLERPLLYSQYQTGGRAEYQPKKSSKFGNIGYFTTEASDGNSDNDEIGGMENFELVYKLFNNRKGDGVIKASDLRGIK